MRPSRTQLLWAGGVAALAFLIIVICGYLFGWKWTGLPKQTLWDWLKLLIIPAVLAGVGLWFNRQQREQELQTADRRAQDEALQAYLDQMSAMLIPKTDQPSLYSAQPGDGLSTVARARTLTMLPRLDGDRKARVVQFLHESGLIATGHPILDLQGADLSDIRMPKADLSDANLSGTNLRGADLGTGVGDPVVVEPYTGAKLRDAWLADADLSGADMCGGDIVSVNLRGAKLRDTKLRSADLRLADLRDTNLRKADLRGAVIKGKPFACDTFTAPPFTVSILSGADLKGADLSGAIADREDIELLARQAKDLAGATMPNGQKYEEWLKSRGDGDSATPEQRGPWWGGPYHRPWWRRMFDA